MLAGEPPKRRMLHTCAEIQWSVCDGCEFLEVTDKRDSQLYKRHGERPFEYRCHANAKDGTLTRDQICVMNKDRCPMGHDVKRRGIR